MLTLPFKASVVIVSLIGSSSLVQAEAVPKQSSDFKANYNLAINDSKAKPETALCSATAHDLTKNKKYKYNRFGFTQADYDAAQLNRNNGNVTVRLSGEARQRNGSAAWDAITVDCSVSKNKVRSVSVTVKK